MQRVSREAGTIGAGRKQLTEFALSGAGSQSCGQGHSCGAASQASGSAPPTHQDESRFVCEMMHLMNEEVAPVKQGEEPLDFCGPAAPSAA